MKTQALNFKKLSEYVDYLQARGTYIFTQKAAQAAVGSSEWAIRMAANRLIAKKRIIKLRYTFYLIIPLEYLTAGAPPPAWYVDALMQYHQQPYYVALLSAAALHGAAHQQPQVFQVMTNKPLRPIEIGRARIQFLVKKDVGKCAITKVKTETGYMNVSTPEVTAFDLIRYSDRVGGLNHVVTILMELAEAIDPEKLVKVAQNEKFIIVQRLGYLMEKHTGIKVIGLLRKWFAKQKKVHAIPLRIDKEWRHAEQDKMWRVYINEKIEIDDI
jgi:predicted transcriptional regulator of viral defense system